MTLAKNTKSNFISSKLQKKDAIAMIGILLFAVIIRLSFFTGFFGSDEITYTGQAFSIANGDWTIPKYIGALRYGVNLPVAFLIKTLGISEFSANLWSFACSVGEVILVYLFGYMTWGMTAAIMSSLIIASLPLHVHFAGRLMADAPLAFFITLSFILFFLAEKYKSKKFYFASGLSCGFVFWIKELVIIYIVVLGILIFIILL